MKHMFRIAALAAVTLGWSISANAGPISFESTVHQLHYIGDGQQKTYWHNLVEEGFVVGAHIAQSFDLEIFLSDDLDFGYERVKINVAGGSAEAEYGSSILNLYLPSVTAYGSTLAQALLQITSTGLLSVTVSSVHGDFFLGSSYLKVYASVRDGVAVGEPGTLALLLAGLAVAGFMFTRRRRRLRAKLLN